MKVYQRHNRKAFADDEIWDTWEDTDQRIERSELLQQNNKLHPTTSPGFQIIHRAGYNSVVYGKGGRGNRKGGMYLNNNKLASIIKSLISGNGVRETARVCGVSKTTVTKAKKKVLSKVLSKVSINPPVCKCGKAIGHKGSCILNQDKKNQERRQWYQENITKERARKRKKTLNGISLLNCDR